ncbi:GntR family transcriptional regulator [Bacteroides mediterraneensis]|uniref:GntR family transcriptional regulator n=1 Tax=Bacteroides mediterraneensis TaxID=1841856 RepID=A0ABS2EWE1_9BACE|nr:GntR family transcriptional regulator [Bacteroides mediterraneensis]MBM6758876.1 GntR family transcriptional regulator [Bacteroides mediterraneensis]MBM6781895.1 GntR family transcriptional regulator [Bacteroides mediterraneensis]
MTFKENKPIYLQIADRIMDEILQHVYEEEGRILSVREYAGVVEVNANTVVRTYDYLQNQGIIYNKRGLGYFVSPGAAQKIVALRKETFLQQVLPDVFKEMYLLHIPMETLAEMFEAYQKERRKSE